MSWGGMGDGVWDGAWGEPAWTELARADGVLGELVLRRRESPSGPLVELVCAGVSVMDDQDAQSEEALAALALDALDEVRGAGDPHVVVGGLGLGFTVAALLADERLGARGRVTVVEVEPAVVAWNRAGLVPATAGVLDDPRVRVVVGDVADVLPGLADDPGAGAADALLLDVDNGPGFLVVPANARLYQPAGLAAAAAALRPGGVLAVWSAQPAPELGEAMAGVVGPSRVEVVGVVREGRRLEYFVHLASRRP